MLSYELFFGSIYAGHHSILIDPAEVELNPSVWMNTISHFKSKKQVIVEGEIHMWYEFSS